ncbi:uncharacterized protein LOC9637926 [Selaginella moellendorffii]|uniref:uncharacterized protein LOC9637926 n=1 Tax=Selaginella moellendorffii TaxID=88036 RepID=UPI000D1C4B43|nr:uncharacterized protein LOC9637926 [Selaginella moellendorffii]|eukprot:XP_024533956.1 uncharacterized protein LOC9637926 [Selaginella moellendorffii]
MLNHDRDRKRRQQFRALRGDFTRHDRKDEESQELALRASSFHRKYEQIMSYTQDDLHGCGRLGKVTADSLKEEEASLIRKRKAAWNSWPWSNFDGGDGAQGSRPYSSVNKKFKQVEAARSSSSPGSNSSEITTDQYMAAESSKSSCFDDACTLATTAGQGSRNLVGDQGGGGELGASTLDPAQAYKTFRDVDFHHGGSLSLVTQQSQQAREKLFPGFSSREEGQQFISQTVVKAEDREAIARGEEFRHDSSASRQRAGEGIDYYNDSWLQLGLGPSSSGATPTKARQEIASPEVSEYPGDDQDFEAPGDVSIQPKPVLHLFPSESVHQIPEYSPHSPLRMPSSQFAGHGETSSSSDFYFGGGAHVPPVRFDSREAAYREHEVAGLLKSMKEAPSTQLMTSYSTSNAATPYAATTTDAARYIDQQRRLSMFAESLVPYHDQRAASLSDPPVHHGGYGGDGSFPSSQLGQFEDRRFLCGSYNAPATATLSHGKRSHQDVAISWKTEGLPLFAPARPDSVYVPTPSPFHATSRLLPSQPPHEDWQALIKRLGGSMQIQSLFPKAAEEDLQQQQQQRSRSNLRDLQEQWSNQEMKPAAWSRHHVLGGQEMMKTMPPFNFPAFEGRVPAPPNVQQGWHSHSSAASLPFFQQLAAADGSSSRERRNFSPPVVRDHDLWFFLRAGENQDSEQWLPQVPKGYLRVKDGAVPVSHVKKYLVHKLGLSCESEVEISCRGQLLQPGLSLQHVRDVIWHSSAAAAEAGAAADEQSPASMTATTPTATTTSGGIISSSATTATPSPPPPSGRSIVMELNYRRQPHQFGPPPPPLPTS